MADHAHRRSTDFPNARIILAPRGTGVFDAIWPRIDDYPNLLFDTSRWNPSTVAALLRLIPPRHILIASDVPFASVAQQAVRTMRLALQVGLDPAQVRGIMGSQARRVRAGQELAFAVDGCTAGADGPGGDVLRALGRLLEEIEDRTEPDPLRALRTPGFDLALWTWRLPADPALGPPTH